VNVGIGDGFMRFINDTISYQYDVKSQTLQPVFSFELGKEGQTRITPLTPNPPMNPIEREKMKKK
jgi:hypothetical protein